MRALYRHELDADDHAELLEQIKRLVGFVILSGYPHSTYDDALPGWRRVEREALADGARPRVEVLWINPQACAALDAHRSQFNLFGTMAPMGRHAT